ncbi:MAG TPA: hypothetical protein VFZ61_17990, partial [Polyangiales bacterium]
MGAPRLKSFLSLFFVLTGVLAHARAEASHAPETIGLHELLQRALVDPPRVLSALASLQRAEADRSAAQ